MQHFPYPSKKIFIFFFFFLISISIFILTYLHVPSQSNPSEMPGLFRRQPIRSETLPGYRLPPLSLSPWAQSQQKGHRASLKFPFCVQKAPLNSRFLNKLWLSCIFLCSFTFSLFFAHLIFFIANYAIAFPVFIYISMSYEHFPCNAMQCLCNDILHITIIINMLREFSMQKCNISGTPQKKFFAFSDLLCQSY